MVPVPAGEGHRGKSGQIEYGAHGKLAALPTVIDKVDI
jgi:hypothetical protein